MKWKLWVVDYLTFTRRERIGILVLICLILLIGLLPEFVSQNSHRYQISTDTAWLAAAKKLVLREEESKQRKTIGSRTGENDYAYQYDRSVDPAVRGSLFNFDPNTLDEAGWNKLGLKDKTIRTIQNYLSKGGHFNKPEDLKRIYGLHPNDYYRLESYIKIESRDDENRKQTFESFKKETDHNHFSYQIIDINTADTSAFISLPGIGSKLAARIVNFREKLGGFYAIAQVGETYGLADSSFQKIKQYLKLENASVRKIDINSATIDQLKNHPYIKYSIANPIIAYRNEHGPFSKIEDIKNVMAITDEIYNKIAPYLTMQ